MQARRGVRQEILETPGALDWARLAAYFDGEGSIYMVKSKKTNAFVFNVKVVNTDIRLPVWCRQIFGGKLYVSNRKRCRPLFSWVVHTRRAEWVLRNCFEFLIVKREQAEQVLLIYSTIGPKAKRTPPHVVAFREAAYKKIVELRRNPVQQVQ